MAKLEYLDYKTLEGDRWDLLANKFYGNLNLIINIVEANPTTPIYERFPAGIKLKIPVIENQMAQNHNLPKWMQD